MAVACQVKEKGPVPLPGYDFCLIISLGFPSKGSRLLGSLLLAPLFPYLVFQPFPHSPASSAAPEVTCNSRTAQRQKGSAGAGESVPMRLTAPACGRER